MTREKLLNASVKAFQDKLNPAYAYQYKIVNTADGYSYISIDYKTKRAITCAIHLATNKEIFEYGGIIAQTNGQLSTREALQRNEMVMYKDYFMFWSGFVEYNETMGQYMYSVRVLPPNDKALLHKITESVGHTCYDKISTIPQYMILPNHADLNGEDFTGGVILLECEADKSINGLHYNSLAQLLQQQRQDNVIFTLLNMTRQQCMRFIRDLQDYSLNAQEFGFIELPHIADETYIDESNGIKSLISKIYAKISYNLASNFVDAEADRIIRTAIYKCKNFDMELNDAETKETIIGAR